VASQIQIANMALQAIGTRSTIASLNENSKEAQQTAMLWDAIRDELLGRAWWNMARKTVQLTLLKAAPGTPEFVGTPSAQWTSAYPAPPWLYSYGYPADCISARYIASMPNTGQPSIPIFSGSTFIAGTQVNGAPIKFVQASDVDGSNNQIRIILTNEPDALLVYTCRITDTELWDADFVSTFATLLAAYLAEPLTGQRSLRKDLKEEAELKVREAATSDANEGLTIQETTPDWLRIRGAGPIDGIGYNS
jgi:hypothetical protein